MVVIKLETKKRYKTTLLLKRTRTRRAQNFKNRSLLILLLFKILLRKQSETPGPDVPKTASKLNVLNEEQQVRSLYKPDQDTLAEMTVCVLCFVKTLDSCCAGAK